MTRDLLVVDDEPVILQAVSRICSAEGLSVDAAEEGADALRMLEKGSYRLALCDIMMPEVDGFALLAQAAKKNIPTPIIMATGYSTVENAVRSLSCGAVDFIAKPFTAEELLTVVRRGLKYSSLQETASSSPRHGPKPPAHVPCPPSYHRLGFISWATREAAGTVLVGASDLFLKTMEGIESLELSLAGEEVAQGRACAVFATADGLRHQMMCPVSGRIMEVNAGAAAGPAIVEKDPYFKGWLYRVLPSDLESDLRQLTPCSSDRL